MRAALDWWHRARNKEGDTRVPRVANALAIEKRCKPWVDCDLWKVSLALFCAPTISRGCNVN
ncbi:hypothetical protein [Sphingobium sp. TomTYG45]